MRPPPPVPKFFHFRAVFGENLGSHPTFKVPPDLGNPGSATVWGIVHCFAEGWIYFQMQTKFHHNFSPVSYQIEESDKCFTMEQSQSHLVCRICGDEVESDIQMIRHITDKHSQDTNALQGKKAENREFFQA